jgi:NitT/TauT family transport system ATP-binding protein
MTLAITLDRVRKRFDSGLEALAEVSLAIAPGEFVAILGPSGCGKTTLLRLVAGLEQPSSGTLTLGVTAAAAPTLSVVFQEPTLMPWATVRNNVALPLRIAGATAGVIAARVAPALGAVGLDAFAAAYPAELSGGMKMRASIARALVTQPDALLMDEPFAALDEITRQRLNADLLALWRERRFTTLFVTHNVFEAVFLAQRVIVLSARPGRLMADIAVEVPALRGPDWRLAPEYLAYCRRTAAALEAGYGAAQQA